MTDEEKTNWLEMQKALLEYRQACRLSLNLRMPQWLARLAAKDMQAEAETHEPAD